MDAHFEALDIARRLRNARLDAYLTQRELAEEVKVGHGQLLEWEHGKYSPRLENLIRWARALGYEVELRREIR